jgi:hypothetical protein
MKCSWLKLNRAFLENRSRPKKERGNPRRDFSVFEKEKTRRVRGKKVPGGFKTPARPSGIGRPRFPGDDAGVWSGTAKNEKPGSRAEKGGKRVRLERETRPPEGGGEKAKFAFVLVSRFWGRRTGSWGKRERAAGGTNDKERIDFAGIGSERIAAVNFRRAVPSPPEGRRRTHIYRFGEGSRPSRSRVKFSTVLFSSQGVSIRFEKIFSKSRGSRKFPGKGGAGEGARERRPRASGVFGTSDRALEFFRGQKIRGSEDPSTPSAANPREFSPRPPAEKKERGVRAFREDGTARTAPRDDTLFRFRSGSARTVKGNKFREPPNPVKI